MRGALWSRGGADVDKLQYPETFARVDAIAAAARGFSPSLPTNITDMTHGARYASMFSVTGIAMVVCAAASARYEGGLSSIVPASERSRTTVEGGFSSFAR